MRKLQELFDLPLDQVTTDAPTTAETQVVLAQLDANIDKIEAALPGVRGLDTGDEELDELATLAKQSFQDLSDLGMNVDSRYASEIFAVASTMLGHALAAKTAKLNKKLKMIDLQLKKARFDHEISGDEPPADTGHGQVLSRNDLLEKLIGSREKKSNSA